MTALFGESFTVQTAEAQAAYDDQATARYLSEMMVEMANTQGAGTPLDGYPGGTPESERTQLGIMQEFCLQAGFAQNVIAAASELTIKHWEERRQHS